MGDWRYAGQARVTSEGKVQLPERLFEEEILHEDRVAYWSFVASTGFVLVSNQPLEDSKYKNQGSSPIGPESEGYLTNIPKVFFADYKGRGRGKNKNPVPEKAQVEYHELRFFAFRENMANRERRSCYMFDWEEFESTIGDDDWADPLSDIPQFG
jgi:hypothetical protein